MRASIFTVIIFLILSGLSGAADRKIYAPGGRGVAVIDPEAKDAWGFIETGEGPGIPSTSRDGRLLFVPIFKSGSVKVIDTQTDGVTKDIEVGRRPYYTDITADGKYLLVSTQGEKSVAVVDTESLEVAGKVNIGTSPGFVRAAPAGDTAYVTGEDTGKLYVLDLKAMKVKAAYDMPSAFDIVFSRSGGVVYINCSGDPPSIKVCDAKTMKVLKSIGSSGFVGMALSDDEKEIWYAGPKEKITVYSLTEDREVAELKRDSDTTFVQLKKPPDGKKIYAVPCGPEGNKIYIYDQAKKEKTGEITLPHSSDGMVFINY